MQNKDPIHSVLTSTLNLHRALHLVWKSAPGWTILNTILIIVQGLLPLLGLYLLRQIVNAVEEAAGSNLTANPDTYKPVLIWLILAAGVALITALLRSLSSYTSQAQSQLVTDHVSDILHAQSILVDLEYYENPAYYDTLHRAQAEAPYRPTSIVNNLIQLAMNTVRLGGLVGVFLLISPWLGVVVILAAIPGAIVRVIYARKRYRFEDRQAKKERLAWYYHWILTTSEFAKEVRLFNIGNTIKRRFQKLRKELREGRLAIVRGRAVVDFIVQSLAALAIFFSLGLAAYQTIQGKISIGDLMAIYMGFQIGLSSIQAILGGLAGLYEDNLFLSHFYKFLELEPTIQVIDNPMPLPSSFQDGIVFENVGFTYPNKKQLVLDQVNLRLEPGQVVALVGANGSGKTTLIKLLCRLYDPTAGRITLDGIPLPTYDPLAWRRLISVIFQDFVHYYLTAKENIWLGNVSQDPIIELIVEASKKSGADSFIKRLPQSYDTYLGTWFGEGQELSTGEWQKVALARAFYRDAQIIVLDEPTSSLDPLAEARFFKQFKKLITGKSAILISHRFSTVQMADFIYLMDKGKIVESGTHDDLMSANGMYATFYHSQADFYQ